MAPKQESVPETQGLSLAAKRLLAIVAYYLIAGVSLALVWRFWPSARQLLSETVLRALTGDAGLGGGAGTADSLSRSLGTGALGGTGLDSASGQPGSTLVVVAAALFTALPVAWVYSLTRRRRGWEQSLVHILVLLPVAVAGLVVLIQNSLALAFSLAGIVAVLRFRNSIDDVKDGVYVFIAITVGISAAVGALTVGVVTSIVFNVCVLTLWWLDFARRPTPGIRGAWRKLMRLPKVVPPMPNDKRVAADGRLGDEVFASAARAWRRQLQLTAEHAIPTDDGRYNSVLQIHTSTPDTSRPLVEDVLRTHTKRWALTGILAGEGGVSTLKYRVFVRKAARAELLDAVRSAPQTAGVELQ